MGGIHSVIDKHSQLLIEHPKMCIHVCVHTSIFIIISTAFLKGLLIWCVRVFACRYACAPCMCLVSQNREVGLNGCEPPRRCWKQNPDSVQEQVLLTSEPCLLPYSAFCKTFTSFLKRCVLEIREQHCTLHSPEFSWESNSGCVAVAHLSSCLDFNFFSVYFSFSSVTVSFLKQFSFSTIWT